MKKALAIWYRKLLTNWVNQNITALPHFETLLYIHSILQPASGQSPEKLVTIV